MNALMDSQVEPFRSIYSWVTWATETSRLCDVAKAVGANPSALLNYLDVSPSTGGRLRGRPIRWASPAEINVAIAHTPPLTEEPFNGRPVLVQWVWPDGKTEMLTLREAASRIVRNDKAIGARQLKLDLAVNDIFIDGHQLTLVPAHPRKADRNRARVATIQPAPCSDSEGGTMTDDTMTEAPIIHPAAAEDGEADQQPGGQRRRRPVMADDRYFQTQSGAAEWLGINKATLSARMRANPDGVSINGVWVRFADDAHEFDHASGHDVRKHAEQAPAAVAEAGSADPTNSSTKRAKSAAQPRLAPDAASLLAQVAEQAGVTVDDALLALLPPSEPMAALLAVVDRSQLQRLSDLDWARLRAISRMAS